MINISNFCDISLYDSNGNYYDGNKGFLEFNMDDFNMLLLVINTKFILFLPKKLYINVNRHTVAFYKENSNHPILIVDYPYFNKIALHYTVSQNGTQIYRHDIDIYISDFPSLLRQAKLDNLFTDKSYILDYA